MAESAPREHVCGANMGAEVPSLAATLDPKALASAQRELVAAPAGSRPHSAMPERLRQGVDGAWRSAVQRAERRTQGTAVLDAKALQHIREDLMDSLPRSVSPLRSAKHEGLRARLHDSPSRSPVAEKRFPGAPQTKGTESVAAGGEVQARVQGLVGLHNLGNTCFINACVQCLSNLAPFARFFLSNSHMFQLNTESSMKGTLALSFGELLHKIVHGTPFTAVSAATLRERVGKFAPQFTGARQHDCQELLRFLLDGLHEDLCSSISTNALMDTYDYQQEYENAASAQAAMVQYYQGNFSEIISSFGGQLVSILKCGTCGHTSNCFDPFLDLSLPIPEQSQVKETEAGVGGASAAKGQPVHLQDCFRAFCVTETLDGENMYMCETCGCRREASKQLRLVRLPPILVVHIKRFCYTATAREKLVTALSFPEAGLDLSPFTVEGGGGRRGAAPIYDLKSVSLHRYAGRRQQGG